MIPLWSPGLLIIFRMEHSEYKIFHFYLHTLSQNNFCKSCSKRYFTGFGSSDFSFYIKIPFTQKSLLLFQKWFPISSNLHIPELLNNCHSLFSEHLFWSLWNIYILFLSHPATVSKIKYYRLSYCWSSKPPVHRSFPPRPLWSRSVWKQINQFNYT